MAPICCSAHVTALLTCAGLGSISRVRWAPGGCSWDKAAALGLARTAANTAAASSATAQASAMVGRAWPYVNSLPDVMAGSSGVDAHAAVAAAGLYRPSRMAEIRTARSARNLHQSRRLRFLEEDVRPLTGQLGELRPWHRRIIRFTCRCEPRTQ